jgi:hypothetical protein
MPQGRYSKSIVVFLFTGVVMKPKKKKEKIPPSGNYWGIYENLIIDSKCQTIAQIDDEKVLKHLVVTHNMSVLEEKTKRINEIKSLQAILKDQLATP